MGYRYNICTGISNAGMRTGKKLDVQSAFSELLRQDWDAQAIADGMLEAALRLDDGRPVDDISVAVMKIEPANGNEIRRVSVWLPLGVIG